MPEIQFNTIYSFFLQPFFFEVMIVNTGQNKEIAVGLSTKSSKLELFPGTV